LTIAGGHDVGYLTGAVGAGRENYYTGAVAAGEPPGVWHGRGAEVLGLSGEVDPEQMRAVFEHLLDPRDPASRSAATWGAAATLGKAHKQYRSAEEVYAAALEREPHAGPERRAELRAGAERATRAPVSFLDCTFSAPKSVSVIAVAFERKAADARAAGDEGTARAYYAHVRAVEEAVLAGARAGMNYLERHAGFARTGHHGGGAGRWIDAPHFVTAAFLQHDSRNGDPQLHVHNPTLNRALGADGQWRALDGRAIYAARGAAGAVFTRTCLEHLARSLGVRAETRPDGKSQEIIGVRSEICDMYSTRSHAITPKAAQLIAAYRERVGREPSALERSRLEKRATLATRPAKSHHGETEAQRLDRWERECRAAMLGSLSEVAQHVLDLAQQPTPPTDWSEQDVIERALAGVAATKQAWTRWDLTRYLTDALPGNLGIGPEQVPELLDALTDTALAYAVRLNPETPDASVPAYLRRADGSSVYSNPTAARYATPGQLAADTALRAAAVRRGADRLTAADAGRAVARVAAESGTTLGADQAAAVRSVLTSGAAVESLTAAAGTGKSFTVGTLARAWSGSGRRVFGMAPSQVATQVLDADGLTARNVSAWLTTQTRLDTAAPGGADPDSVWRLQRGDLVIVDEAGMVDTGDLAAMHARCDAAGAKLLLVGDPRQLAAVGAGGALADVAAHGINYQLAEVRRFDAEWERAASLGLRDGDPGVLDAYDRHGRLIDGGTAEHAEAGAGRAWLADTLTGQESLLLVPTNEAAGRVSAALRADLVALGHVAENGVELGMQGTVAGVGDLVQARRNGWELIGYTGNTRAPINRETYRVTGVREDGGLTVAPVVGRDDTGERLGEPLALPGSYVAEHLTLGYASTVHAAQGRTVDTAHAVLGAGTDAAGAYVALTRGRERNTAWVVTTPVPDDAPTGQTREVTPRTAHAVLSDIIEQDPGTGAPNERSSLGTAEHAADAARSIQQPLDQLAAEVAELTAGRTGALLDRLAAEGAITDRHRETLAADDAYESLEQVLRTAEVAGHDPRQVLAGAVAAQSLDTARWPARVLHSRISEQLRHGPTPELTSFADLIPRTVTDEQQERLQVLAATADERRRDLGVATAEQAPPWALEALGPVPDDPLARVDWEQRAGWAAAHREATGHTADTDALGARPAAGLAEKRAVWNAAHDALNLPDSRTDEVALTDGQLRIRVRAFEREETWAPRYVADELAATHQAAQRHRADARLWAARADVADDPDDPGEAETLRSEAARAQAETDTLAERVVALEAADEARAAWYAATAATRDAAECARAALTARGVDPDDTEDRVTAAEWLDAHRAEQAAEDPRREVRDEHELADVDASVSASATEPTAEHRTPEPVLETAAPDLRDTSVSEATETTDPAQRRRVPTADETAAAVARAQATLAEIEARREADAAQEAEETAHAARSEELARWAEQDRTAETEAGHELAPEADDAFVLER